MDHPCHKCGHSIEDGKPFCAQCGAPQIRVAVPEPSAPSITANASGGELPVFPFGPPIVGRPMSATFSTGIEWPRALRACALAALISIVVTSLRLVFPLVAVLGAGFLAVIFYHRRNPAWRVNARAGAQLGAVTALLSSGVLAVFSAIAYAVLQAGGQVREQAIEALQQVASRSNDPQMQATLDLLRKPEGLGEKLILAMVFLFVVSVAASGIAGALTGAFLGRRNRP
jgi:zinc-ribbon domain